MRSWVSSFQQIIYFIIFFARVRTAQDRKAPILYNSRMQRLFHMLAAVALVYGVYVLIFKRWDYYSEAKREEEKTLIKKQGLSTRYYFISTPWLLGLNILSGGGFFFYWTYKQWQAMRAGFIRADKRPLAFSPVLRTLCFFFSLYQFNAILNRTCIYMRKHPAFPPWLWGTLIWLAPLAAALPLLSTAWRIAASAVFLIIPPILQKRVNSLSKTPPPFRLKTMEIVWVLICWVIYLGTAVLYKRFG